MAGRWRSPRIDNGQHLAVTALRAHGWAVVLISHWGGPVDLLCADLQHPHAQFICEMKDGAKPPSERRLQRRCFEFLMSWPGPAAVAKTYQEAVKAGELCRAGQLQSGAAAARAYFHETGEKFA